MAAYDNATVPLVNSCLKNLVYGRTIHAKYAFALFDQVMHPGGEVYFRKATESVYTTFQGLAAPGSPLLIVTNSTKDTQEQALAVGIVFVQSQACAKTYHDENPHGPHSLWTDQQQLVIRKGHKGSEKRQEWLWKWVLVLGPTRLRFKTPFPLNCNTQLGGQRRNCVAWRLAPFELRTVGLHAACAEEIKSGFRSPPNITG